MKAKKRYNLIRRVILSTVIVILICSALFGGYRAITRSAPDLRPLSVVLHPQDFTLKISANGELQSAESIAVAVPPVPVQRLRIGWAVPDGTHVNKGDVLIEFDPDELNLEMMGHRSDLQMALEKITRGGLANSVEKTDIVKDKKIAELELEKIIEFLPQDEQIYKRREIIEGQLDKEYTEKKIVFADARLGLKGKVYSLDEAILMLERGRVTANIDRYEKALA